jgi:hypothetical protein
LQEPDPRLRSSHNGQFTWNGSHNSVAKPLTSDSPPAFAWIDSVLACGYKLNDKEKTPLVMPARYIDNRSLAMKLPVAVPEISPFWTSKCFLWRRSNQKHDPIYDQINTLISSNLFTGFQQRQYLLRQFFKFHAPASDTEGTCGTKNMLQKKWIKFVLGAPYNLSSQIWKGPKFYGLRTDDLHVHRETQHLKIGDPHPFRMLQDVSDHHAVLARILLS